MIQEAEAMELSEVVGRALAEMPPRDPDELWNWVCTFLNIRIPRRQVCPNCSAPFDAFADAYFARHPVAVWEGSRGFAGKSFLLATLALTEQITLGASTSLLGGSGEQAQRIHQYLSGEDPNAEGKFWDAERAPDHLLKSDPTKRETRTTNGGYIKALMASQTSVRGPHPHRLRFDEIDEADIRILDSALGQAMGSRGVQAQTVLSSTHQYPDGTMTEIKKRAAEKGWPRHVWCYRECLEENGGWLPRSEVERKKIEIPRAMWESEYENQEPSPRERAIDPEAVEALFDRSLGVYEERENKEIIVAKPRDDGKNYSGADWAKRQDYTIIHTMEKRSSGPDQLAAWRRMRRRPWPVMISAYNKRVETYKGPSYHDITGVGDVVDDYLEVRSKGWDFRKRKDTQELLSYYIAAIENGEMVYPFIEYPYREHLYASVDQVYGNKHLPDSIAAAALAWKARNKLLHRRAPAAAML